MHSFVTRSDSDSSGCCLLGIAGPAGFIVAVLALSSGCRCRTWYGCPKLSGFELGELLFKLASRLISTCPAPLNMQSIIRPGSPLATALNPFQPVSWMAATSPTFLGRLSSTLATVACAIALSYFSAQLISLDGADGADADRIRGAASPTMTRTCRLTEPA